MYFLLLFPFLVLILLFKAREASKSLIHDKNFDVIIQILLEGR